MFNQTDQKVGTQINFKVPGSIEILSQIDLLLIQMDQEIERDPRNVHFRNAKQGLLNARIDLERAGR